MLEKNKDYIEMCISSTDCTFTRNTVKFSIEGYIDSPLCWSLPDPGDPYVIISKEKLEALQTENEQLKKELNDFDPMPEVKELLKNLYSTEDVEKLEWTLNHVCGGMGSVNGWWVVSSFWKKSYKILSKLIGFSSVEEIQDYLTNEAECDTLHEAFVKNHHRITVLHGRNRNLVHMLKKEWRTVRELQDMLCDRTSATGTHNVIARWQKVTGFNDPKDFLKWKTNIEGIMEAWKSATGCKYPAEARILLEKWKALTKCETPEAAATWITSYESACERGNSLARKVEEWKEETGCPSPSSAKTAIEAGASWHHAYNESKEVNKKFADSIKAWQNVTGYATPEDYLAAVIKNTAKAALSWQEITGFSTPEKCSSYIDILEKKLEDIKDLIEED